MLLVYYRLSIYYLHIIDGFLCDLDEQYLYVYPKDIANMRYNVYHPKEKQIEKEKQEQ